MKINSMVLVLLVLITLAVIYCLRNIQLEMRFCPTVHHEVHEDPVRERLAESQRNWNRALEKRNAFEGRLIFNPERPWGTGVYFWDLFYPSFDCPHTVERIGKIGDGGKWMCGVEHLSKNCKNAPVIVYSFGINGEITFEEEILARTNFSVYMFDHTIDIASNYGHLQDQYPGRVFLEQIGLGAHNGSKESMTLESIMKKYGHEFVDILKADIEWAEWEIIRGFKQMFPSGSLPFGQLLIEFHLPKKTTESVQPHVDAIKLLEKMHVLPFKMEFNLGGLYNAKLALFCEYAFINTAVDNCLLHSHQQTIEHK